LKSITRIVILTMVLLAQGCTINIGASSESSPVVPEQNQKLSFISAPLQAVNLLKDYGAPCQSRIESQESEFSAATFYRVSCVTGEPDMDIYIIDIFETEESFLDDRDAVCDVILPENQKNRTVMAFGKNWWGMIIGISDAITISDVATALGGQTGDDPGFRCQFQE